MWSEVNQPSAESPAACSRRVRAGRERTRDRAKADRGARRRVSTHHPPSIDVKRGGRRLQQFGGGLDRLVAQRGRREPRRLAGHDGDARGERADAALDAVGLAVDDAHLPVIDAERIGADLREHGLDALADRRARR